MGLNKLTYRKVWVVGSEADHGEKGEGLVGGLNKIVAAGCEGIDQQAILKRQNTVDEIWGDDEAGASAQSCGDAVHGDVETAFGHVADLGVRMGMQCADSAFVKAEGDEHEFRAL
jgi:hypothetical protein